MEKPSWLIWAIASPSSRNGQHPAKPAFLVDDLMETGQCMRELPRR
jgi:predicted amidophosphoribosyltransferase